MRRHLARRSRGAAGPDRIRVGRLEREFGAADRRQFLFLGRFGKADRAVEPVAIGQGEAGQACRHRRANQLFGVRGALEEREVRPGGGGGGGGGGGRRARVLVKLQYQ